MDPFVVVGVVVGVGIGAYARGYFEGWREHRRGRFVNCTCAFHDDRHLSSCPVARV